MARGRSSGRGRFTGPGSKPIPRVVPQVGATHTYNSVKAMMPDLSSSERTVSGVAPIKGNLRAAFPRITGFNAPGSLSTPY